MEEEMVLVVENKVKYTSDSHLIYIITLIQMVHNLVQYLHKPEKGWVDSKEGKPSNNQRK